MFTTKDADHDTFDSGNCAELYEGGWWYTSCYDSNLNGKYNETNGKGVRWWWTEAHKEVMIMQFTEMKFRKRLNH